MQFCLTAYDHRDGGAMERRLSVREAHLAGARRMYAEGQLLYAAATLSDEGKMIGSRMIVEFADEAALRAQWLDSEPYVTGDVWGSITIEPCAVPEFILK